MAFNINSANSCKLLVVNATRYDASSTQADITLTDQDTGSSVTVVMNYDAGTGRGILNIPVSNLPASAGVFRVCINEGGIEYGCKPILLHCDIDCCLTKLTNELMDCGCDCPRCSKTLAKAQKVYLLLQSARSTVNIAGEDQSSGYYKDILAKYKKAKEICDNSCGCDC